MPQPELDGWLNLTPRYQAARFAVFDDRLEEARADLFRMLALVERGEGEELVGRAAQPLRGVRLRGSVSRRTGLRRAGDPGRPGSGAQSGTGLVQRRRGRTGRWQPGPRVRLRRAGRTRLGAGARRHPLRTEPARARPGAAALGRRSRRGRDVAPDPGIGTRAGSGRTDHAALALAIWPRAWSRSADSTRPRRRSGQPARLCSPAPTTPRSARDSTGPRRSCTPSGASRKRVPRCSTPRCGRSTSWASRSSGATRCSC